MIIKSHPSNSKEPNFKQSFIFTTGLIGLGFVIQWFGGGLDLTYLKFPVNFIILLFVCLVICIGYFKYPNSHLVEWLSSTKAAITSIIGFSFITLLMGFITQEDNTNKFITGFGLNNIAYSWQYSLSLLYLMFSLGFATIKRIYPFHVKNFWYILNHLGLWIALCAANFGFVDQLHLRMKINPNEYMSFAIDQDGGFYNMPFNVIQTKAENLSLYIDVLESDIVTPLQISINNPAKLHGWNFYVFDINNGNKKSSVIEIIKEPWQPLVYIGLIMMIIGSFFVFWRGKK